MNEASRFEVDPEALLGEPAHLPDGWLVDTPGPEDVARLTELLRAHEERGRGWAGAGPDDVLVEVAGRRTRENVVVRDETGTIRAWGSVHDRAGGRMLLVHVVERDLAVDGVRGAARACSDVLVDWALAQAREVGAARGLAVQQVDTGAFADDERQQRWLGAGGFERVRTWWQMVRPVTPDEAGRVPDPGGWSRDDLSVRLVRRGADGQPHDDDLRAVHHVLEEAFADHFNSRAETFEEFVHRLAEDPGHRWDHWWLAEVHEPGGAPYAAGALVGTQTHAADGPDGSYVAYVGVLERARGRGVARALLDTVVADAAARGRDRVGLEVDADSPTGADRLYTRLGWRTAYTTESWHRDVEVGGDR